MKDYLRIIILVLTVWAAAATVAAVHLWLTRNADNSSPSIGPIAAPILEPAPEGGVLSVTLPETNGADTGTIDDVLDPEPAPIPTPVAPVVVHPQSAQGLRRVEFNPPIGDIYYIHYDQRSGYLFMATVETGGVRAIWRLSSDLELRRVLLGNSRPGEIFLSADSQGVLYAGFSDPGYLFRSADLGDSWTLVADNIDGAFWSLADDGHGTLWASLHAYNKAWLYRSTDYGNSWRVWKNFQEIFPEYAVNYREGDDRLMLRHLHDVAFEDGRLFVGVGDVARFTVMSADDGETWQEVWSEGFTAHVPTIDGDGLLLGPDRLQTHGIALHDFASGQTTEVWSPIPYGYAGYTYSMMEMNGVYYAAFHTETNEVQEFAGKSGIIVSPDGYHWYPFLELDPLTHWARTDIFMSPGRRLNGSFSEYGFITLNGVLYQFEPPIGRWFEVHTRFE
jgi:hypothetical protein